MSLWLSGMPASSENIQRYVLGGRRELGPELKDGARVQSDTRAGHGRSVLSAGEWCDHTGWLVHNLSTSLPW